jgi:hypothetical protein
MGDTALPGGVGEGQHRPVRRAVPEGAYEFARDRLWLARGLKPFVRDLLVPERCSCWTLAGRDVSDERLAQFDVGGFVAPGYVAELVASEVAPIIAGSEDRVLLVPDPMARPGDPFLKRETIRHIVVGDGVYYVEGSAETERLVTGWRAGSSAAGQMAVVSSVSQDLMRDELDLQRAADASVLLMFEAYDGYGALFFARRGEAFRLPD